ncbi:MAG: hypothetical protein ACREOC_15405 [Gemmatimonadales bacterium]
MTERPTHPSDPPARDSYRRAKDAVLELRDFLLFSGHLSGPELAVGIDQRLDTIAELPEVEQDAIAGKLLALRDWVGVLGAAPRLEAHGGAATVRSLLLADCGVMYCYLAGPPDECALADPVAEGDRRG